MKKGFTLLELLAVIIVLAIIGLIIVPMLLNVINNIKKSSFSSSVNGIIDAITYKSFEEQLAGGALSKTYTFPNNELVIKGSQPDGGTARVDSNGRIQVAVYDGTWCATKNYMDSVITVKEYVEGECIVTDSVNGN